MKGDHLVSAQACADTCHCKGLGEGGVCARSAAAAARVNVAQLSGGHCVAESTRVLVYETLSYWCTSV